MLVHVAIPMEVCAARDRKGIYAPGRAGVITNLTGVGDDYEVPAAPDLAIDMPNTTPGVAATMISSGSTRWRASAPLQGRPGAGTDAARRFGPVREAPARR